MNIDRQTWSGKFSLLSPWFSDILAAVKRDCKSEHLSVDPYFVRKHFAGKPVQRISLEEMRAVYMREILSGQDKVAEFIANRWLFRHMELYRFFEEELGKISPEFDKINELTVEQGDGVIQKAKERFDCEEIFIFTIINDVAFPEPIFEKLQKEALETLAERQKNAPPLAEDDETERFRQEMDRMKEKHEKKLQEVAKRHGQETARLNAEISELKKTLKNIQAKELSRP
jgi:hypothetical protein